MTVAEVHQWAERRGWRASDEGPIYTKLVKVEGQRAGRKLKLKVGLVVTKLAFDDGQWVELNKAPAAEIELNENDQMVWPEPKPPQVMAGRIERVFVYDNAWSRVFETRASQEQPAFGWHDRRKGSKNQDLQTGPLPRHP